MYKTLVDEDENFLGYDSSELVVSPFIRYDQLSYLPTYEFQYACMIIILLEMILEMYNFTVCMFLCFVIIILFIYIIISHNLYCSYI